MVTVINKRVKKEKLSELLNRQSEKGNYLKTSKYIGKINLKEDPLKVQKKLRDEWK
jgi:hypothetical protein